MIDTFLKSFAVESRKEHLYWEPWLAKVRDKPYHHNDGKAEPVDLPNVTWSKVQDTQNQSLRKLAKIIEERI